MCEENKKNSCGPTSRDHASRMHHMMGGMHHMGGHGHDEGKNGLIMKKIIMKKIMEQLSDEDKKKILVAKMDMKISMAEQEAEIMKEKKRIIAAKMDMKASMAQQKIDLIKMIRDMIKD
jgi:hypothetical protein